MDNEFSLARVKKYLGEFRDRLDRAMELIEDSDLTKDEIMSSIKDIYTDMNQERNRATKASNSILEETNYIPALDEVIMYVGNSLEGKSFEEVSTQLYDASFSAGYYLSGL